MLSFNFSFDYFPNLVRSYSPSSAESNKIQTKVYGVFPTHMTIEWSISSSLGSCTFNVFQSETEYGPWTKLTQSPITGNYLKIPSSGFNSKFSNGYLVVEATRTSNNAKVRSKPTTIVNTHSTWVGLRAKEITRREWLLLDKFSGVESLVFKRRNFGKRCSECWDPLSEKVIKDHCDTCLGTSFEGGYFPGYSTKIQYEPTPNNTALTYSGRVEPNTIPAWTVNFPEITTLDVILRVPDWRIYRVDAVLTTELQSIPLRQLLSLTELSKESIEFQLAKQAIPNEYT